MSSFDTIDDFREYLRHVRADCRPLFNTLTFTLPTPDHVEQFRKLVGDIKFEEDGKTTTICIKGSNIIDFLGLLYADNSMHCRDDLYRLLYHISDPAFDVHYVDKA